MAKGTTASGVPPVGVKRQLALIPVAVVRSIGSRVTCLVAAEVFSSIKRRRRTSRLPTLKSERSQGMGYLSGRNLRVPFACAAEDQAALDDPLEPERLLGRTAEQDPPLDDEEILIRCSYESLHIGERLHDEEPLTRHVGQAAGLGERYPDGGRRRGDGRHRRRRSLHGEERVDLDPRRYRVFGGWQPKRRRHYARGLGVGLHQEEPLPRDEWRPGGIGERNPCGGRGGGSGVRAPGWPDSPPPERGGRGGGRATGRSRGRGAWA